MKQRIIALVDCDCFFVSCERVRNPQLIGKPVCVMTAHGERGVIVSRSKEAKAIGVRMGEPYFQAKVEHPDAICISANHSFYRKISQKVMDVVRSLAPEVEVVSVDEAFADITGCDKLRGTTYTQFAKNMRSEILAKTGIPVSIGVCSSKTLAKLASDKAKNLGGICAIRPAPENIIKKIGGEKIASVSGIGSETSRRLAANHINTIGEFVSQDDAWLKKFFSINAVALKHELLGETVSPVNSAIEPPQSIQDTGAFEEFSTDLEFMQSQLAVHIHNASKRLRFWDGYCSTVWVMLRTKNFRAMQAKTKLSKPTNSERTLRSAARKLLNELYEKGTIYRATGITLSDLTIGKTRQISLFGELDPEDDKISRLIDNLEEKFGAGIIKIGD